MKPLPDVALTAAREFGDLDELSSALAGWDLRLDQLEPGPFSCQLTQIQCGPVMIEEGMFGQKVHQQGAAPRGCWTFGIPLSPTTRYRWRGRNIEPDQLIGFESGIELDSVSDPGFHILAASIQKEAAAEICRGIGVAPLEESIVREAVLRCPPAELMQLQRFGNALTGHAKKHPGPITRDRFSATITHTLPTLLAEVFSRRTSQAFTLPPHVRSKALKRALDAIRERAAEPLSISELNRLSGASSRTLRYAFEEAFGMPPKAFLQAYRLNEVRRLLKQRLPGSSGSISDVANEWGFWHMGQFAADYRAMFGELPSETLRRALRSRG